MKIKPIVSNPMKKCLYVELLVKWELKHLYVNSYFALDSEFLKFLKEKFSMPKITLINSGNFSLSLSYIGNSLHIIISIC